MYGEGETRDGNWRMYSQIIFFTHLTKINDLK